MATGRTVSALGAGAIKGARRNPAAAIGGGPTDGGRARARAAGPGQGR